MRVLALDLGTTTGWALLDGGKVTSGSWLLATEKELRSQKKESLDRCCDMRPSRLAMRIQHVGPVDWVWFEDVQFLSSQLQAQLWASLRAVVSMLYPDVKVGCTGVGTLKKFGSGKGNATKGEMSEALYLKSKGFYEGAPETLVKDGIFLVERSTQRPVGNDEVDALHLLGFARNKLNV